MTSAPDASGWRCSADALPPGQAVALEIGAGAGLVPGFIVNHEGRHYAYVNRCPHAGSPLDRQPGSFFTGDGRHLVCGTHGAVFAPETGVCVEGPCPGARLETLRVARDGPDVVVTRTA